MEIRREGPVGGPVVKGFSGTGFRVSDAVFPRGVTLSPEAAAEWEAPGSVAELAPDSLETLLAIDPLPEFLLLGTGPSLVQPPRAFVKAVEARGIGVEAMDSRAAARAWGVLRQEERWIVAALMPLG